MRPSEALALRRAELVRVASAHGARNVRVFGSVLRGDDTESSDLDILVDVPPGTSLLDMARLQQEIEAALVSTERACVWTLGGLLDADQFDRLLGEAEDSLRPFVTAEGTVAFVMPALII